ncbi:hypothetical protein QBC44DRAFT_372908 [Cladorrhinum sp. PSN332]|nr:hypothetical protein QBC44DRAFT_372908 [Cladorrhinum sp. PSN332]
MPMMEDYLPVEDSDTKHSQDDVKSQRRKRRRVNASTLAAMRNAAQQQTHQFGPDRSRQIQRSSRPLKRRSQRSNPSPPLLGGHILGEETTEASVAKFEEWPLGNAIFNCITLNGVLSLQLKR